MLIATIILNKYQQHLFNISTLVFNNTLQCTLESFACGTRQFLGIHVPFSSQVRLSLLVQIVRFLALSGRLHVFPVSWNFFTAFQNISSRIWRFSRWRNYWLLSCGEVKKDRGFYLSLFPELKLTNIYLWNIKYTY